MSTNSWPFFKYILMHWDAFKQDNYSALREYEGCRVDEVRAGTSFPMPNHKSFKLQKLSKIHPLHFKVNFQKFSTLTFETFIRPLVLGNSLSILMNLDLSGLFVKVTLYI